MPPTDARPNDAQPNDAQPNDAQPNDAPIGYWLKRADDLIDQRQAEAFAGEGVYRSHWQVLNLVPGTEPTRLDAVFETMRTFLGDDGHGRLDAIVADLAGRAWLQRGADGSTIALTPAGVVARERLLERVQSVRQRMLRGIGEAEYRATVGTLRRMVSNLDVT
jgi:hypothetical protein